MSIHEKNTAKMAWQIVERDGGDLCPGTMKKPGVAGTVFFVFEAWSEPAFHVDFFPLPKAAGGRVIVEIIHVGKGNRCVAAKGGSTRKLLFEHTPRLFEHSEPADIFGLDLRDGLLFGQDLYLLSQFDTVYAGNIFRSRPGKAAVGTDVPMGLSIREQVIME